ncbi:MAG: efflux RND transporter permease subunit [Verrucomicrobia bacterium]|jgi:multidrug efflux pump|nr:efflux RND transporter permease subunit [Verrucomicrobiota bacterium]
MLLSNYAVKFRVAVFVLVLVFLLAGINSYVSLPREGTPDITISYVFVTVVHEGTAPEEMEKLVTIPIERQLNDLENVKEIRSTSSDSVTFVSIEFLAGQDIDMALQKAKDKVDLARPDLPDDLEEPIVQAMNFSSDIPIFVFALSGETSLPRLTNLAEDLKEEIELLSGVKQAEISGARERELRVELDVRRLASYRIPVEQVLQRIAGENKTMSVGNLEIEGDKFQVRVPGEFRLASELPNIVIVDMGGQSVYLRDIATVVDTHKDLESISRLNGEPSVSVSVKKRAGENSVRLIDSVKAAVANVPLPPGVTLTIVMDESEYVDMMIKELENNVATGFILVVVVLFIFMGVRNSLFVAMAIPISMLIAFASMSFMGFTLNMIVLFSLVLAVGMLVDNAIVIVENIYRNRMLGMTRHEAARRGAGEVAWPVITSTLTTCAAFSPLLFWPGMMGQFMGFMPRTLIVTLLASLFVAIVVNPAICSFFIGGSKREAKEEEKTHPFVHAYERFLTAALRHRVPVVLMGFAFLVLTIQIYGRFGEGQELFPDVAPRNAVIEVKFPQGTSIERTDEALRAIEQKIPEYADVEFYLTTVGAGGGGGFLGSGVGSHLGTIRVEFLDYADRAGDSAEIVDALRKDIGSIPGAEVKVDKEEEGPPTGAPISIELTGDDFETLSELSASVVRRIETVPGLVDLQDDYEEALPELRFNVDRKRAALVGLDMASIGLFLRTAIYGLEASKLRIDEEEFDITLRFPKAERSSAKMLDEIYIPVMGGASVPLSSLGRVEYAGGRGTISRKDQNRVITISGSNHGRGVDKILADIQGLLKDFKLPSGYAITYAGDNQEMEESGAFLSKAFAVALGLILVILVIQFNSALLPIIIVFSVVLSLIGVMWGLLICHMRFGVIMTGVGVISLAGIVVNNAIVLVDCVRQRKEDGMDTASAVVAAGRLRLRPVLLTAITTVLGLIPMAVGYSFEFHEWPPRIVAGAESSQWWAPMAVAVIFGLGVATVLTLVLVPLMYSLVDSFVAWMAKYFGVHED